MVSISSIIFMAVSAAISILLPVGLVIYMYRKEKISIKAVFVGALIFILFQMVTRIPLLNYISTQEWYIKASTNPWFLVLFLSLTAGLFEEVGRFLGFKLLLKGKLQWKNGIAFGIGHGGIESILLAGLAMINYIIYSVLINSGQFDTLIASQLPAATAEALRSALLTTPPPLFLLSGFERMLAITAHIGFSLVVLYGIINRKNIYLLYAILLHALLDAPIVLIGNKVILYLYIFAWAVVSFIMIIKSKKIFEDSEGKEELPDIH